MNYGRCAPSRIRVYFRVEAPKVGGEVLALRMINAHMKVLSSFSLIPL